MRLFRRLPSLKSLTDEELVENFRLDGDTRWVGELFERYTHMVFLVCMKYLKDELEAEDMSMRLFEKLLQDLRKYEIKTFRFWLHTVVKNQCLLHLDRRKRERLKADAYEHEVKTRVLPEMSPFAAVDGLDKELRLQQMEAALGHLKREQRLCLELFYLQQKSYQEVADQTGYSLKQVKSYIQNGKRMLKKQMET